MVEPDPHYHKHRQRLRERFLKAGLEGFADYEVVELLLTLAIPRVDVKQPAKALIARFGNLRGILDASLEDLQKTKGIGSVAPVALRIIRAVVRRIQAEEFRAIQAPETAICKECDLRSLCEADGILMSAEAGL